MNVTNAAHDYLLKITQRLEQKSFRIHQDILHENQVFECVANRIRFQLERGGLVATFYVFARFSDCDVACLRAYSAKCFMYSKRASGIHPPRGLFFSILCFPVAIFDSIDSNTAEAVRRLEPPKHWAASEMLVALSLDDKKLYYYEGTRSWGAMYFDYDRLTIKEMLTP